MKHKITILILFFSYIVCNAQEFGTSDSKWLYDHNGVWSEGITEIQYEKDSLIDWRLTKKFTKKGTRRIRPNGIPETEILKPIYIHTNNGIIEFSVDALHFDTLINFQAYKGKSWKIFRYYKSFKVDSIELTVLDTFRTRISGHDLFGQAVKYTIPNWTNFVDTVYEYIGGKWLYILPFDDKDIGLDGGEGGLLRCFHNSLIGVVQFNTSQFGSNFPYDCQNLTGVKINSIDDSSIKLYLNAGDDYLIAENHSMRKISANLSNIYGQLIYNLDINPGMEHFDLSSLYPGIYIIASHDKILSRFIIE